MSIFSLFIVTILYNNIIYRLKYKTPLESLRIERIRKLYSIKEFLWKRIHKLNSRIFKKDKQKAKAFNKIEKMKKKIKQINVDLFYLENYGEKT